MPDPHTIDYTLKRIDRGLWYAIKALAARRQITIKALIIQLLTKELDNQ